MEYMPFTYDWTDDSCTVPAAWDTDTASTFANNTYTKTSIDKWGDTTGECAYLFQIANTDTEADIKYTILTNSGMEVTAKAFLGTAAVVYMYGYM